MVWSIYIPRAANGYFLFKEKVIMLSLIAILAFVSLPIIAYLLSNAASQKALVFFTTAMLFGALTLNHSSPQPLFGSWVNSIQSDAIENKVFKNLEISDEMIMSFLAQKDLPEDSFLLGTIVFYKALEFKSFNSAESILRSLNSNFREPDFQLPIYNLLADLRDLKYPMVSNSKLLLAVEPPVNCSIDRLTVSVEIPNGPAVDIAVKDFIGADLSQEIFLDKSDALVRGFDLPSAFLNQEIIKVESSIFCKNNAFYSIKTIDLKGSRNNQDEVFIYANEWLKKEQ
jgi:hypothetical protein